MKKIPRAIFILLLVLLLSGCGMFQGNKKEENSVQYEIYQLAKESGYEGNYEEWLNSIKGKDGADGQEIELFEENMILKWRYKGQKNSFNLIDLYSLQGAPGSRIQLDVQDGCLVWKYEDEKNWTKLYELNSVPGGEGPQGPQGPQGIQGADGKSAYEIYCERYPEYNKTEEEWLDDLVNGRLGNEESLTYTVTFNPDGGSFVESQEVKFGHKVNKPEDPYKENYVFEGWYCGDEKWSFIGFVVTENIELVAKWSSINCSVGLEINLPNYYNYEFIECEFNTYIGLPIYSDIDGFRFVGWKDINTNEIYYDSYYVTKKDSYLQSLWSFDVTYNFGDSSINESYCYLEENYFLSADDLNGKKFIGWYDRENNELYYPNEQINLDKYTVLDAIYEYDVILNGIDSSYEVVEITSDTINLLNEDIPLTNNGDFICRGWFLNSDYTTLIVKYPISLYGEDIYLYGLYKEGLIFDLNGGTSLYDSLEEFGHDIVKDFNNYDSSTKYENFLDTSHPAIKSVFSNPEMLLKYNWLFKFAKQEITNATNANIENGNFDSSLYSSDYCQETVELLNKLIAGDTEAINGNYPFGRTIFRQFIHSLINKSDPKDSMRGFEIFVFDYSQEINYIRFNQYINVNQYYLNDILPAIKKDGKYFIGWSDGENIYSNETPLTYNSNKFVAVWGNAVTLDLNGGSVVQKFSTYQAVKEEFIYDLNSFLGTDYTMDSSFMWAADAYKIFLDPTLGVKWRPLLQYFHDVENEQKNTIVNPGKFPNAKYDLYEWWDDLMAGKDLNELNPSTAPYCVSFALQAWTKKILLETTFHFSADYSSEEVQNRVLDYFNNKSPYIIVEEGKSILLPSCELGYMVSIGFMDENGNIVTECTPTSNVTLVAVYESKIVTLNVNDDEIDPIDGECPEFISFDDSYEIILPVLTRSNYTFEGWFDKYGTRYEVIYADNIFNNLTAKWLGDSKYIYLENGNNDYENCEMNKIDDIVVAYGQKIDELTDAVADGFVFEGWFTKDGTDGDWGEAFDIDQEIREDITLYAKFIQIPVLMLNYGDAKGSLTHVWDAREAFLTDFYNWCLAQNAFTAEEMTKEAFIGAAEGQLTFNGLWVNYSGGAGNPSILFPVFDSANMQNFFMAPKGETGSGRECGVIENSTYFLNDAAMNAKWGPYMAHIAKICGGLARVWGPEASNYFIYELGRTFLADDATFQSSYGSVAIANRARGPIAGCEHLLYSSYTETVEFTVFSLTEDNKLPEAYKEGYVFVGWTMGGKPYTYYNVDLDGKELTPVFVEDKAEADFIINYASSRQAPKGNGELCITNGTYVNGEVWPSAVFRDKVLLKYNAQGQLEVVAVGLNGVRITTDPSKSYYLAGQSDMDWDLIIIGYSVEADTTIQSLGLVVGDIIEIAAANEVYDVLDGADSDNWTPDHEVNLKAYIN